MTGELSFTKFGSDKTSQAKPVSHEAAVTAPEATTTSIRSDKGVLHHGTTVRSNVNSSTTLSLSRSMCFEVAVLSPLAAACDTMDAAMLTRTFRDDDV